MRSGIDFSSWQALLSTLLGLGVVTLIMVGIRLVVMQTMQQRRERQNRQINERLRTLIAAYKTLGGSFTGKLAVDPGHRGDLRRAPTSAADSPAGERRRRIRDAVEAALADVILLGTEEQVRLAAQAANDLAAGRPVETAAIVISLRDFIRAVLDLAPVPEALAIPAQGPVRPGGSAGRGAARGDAAGGRDRAGGGGGQGGGGAAMGGAAAPGGKEIGPGIDTDDPPHR